MQNIYKHKYSSNRYYEGQDKDKTTGLNCLKCYFDYGLAKLFLSVH